MGDNFALFINLFKNSLNFVTIFNILDDNGDDKLLSGLLKYNNRLIITQILFPDWFIRNYLIISYNFVILLG